MENIYKGLFPVYFKDEQFQEPNDTIYYIIAKNGVFQVKKTKFFVSSTLVFESKNKREIEWLHPHKSSIKLALQKKIPFERIAQVMSFFKDVYQKYHSEAIVIMYWFEKDERYEMKAPNQKVAPGRLPYYEVGKNPDGAVRVGTIHSHGRIDAFHSNIDHADEENDDGIHITIGNIDTIVSISCSIMADGERQIIDVDDIIEGNQFVSFPNDWTEHVKENDVCKDESKLKKHSLKDKKNGKNKNTFSETSDNKLEDTEESPRDEKYGKLFSALKEGDGYEYD
ncbi:MAG: hypothetical protein HYW78_01175 [Parcubacteria group bacterium]|nr:hypothetical protein [Parcubacteria group bacterium]